MKYLILLLILTSCTKEITMKTIVKQCESEWLLDGSYETISFEVEAGTGVLTPYAELTGMSSQGLTWVFSNAEGVVFELTDTDDYYQEFHSDTTSFFPMWETAHDLTFPCAGTLTVRKYAWFTENEKVCLYSNPTLTNNTVK